MRTLKSLAAGAAAAALLLGSVPASSAAQFYDHADFRGEVYDSYGHDVYYFGDMNDRISSIRSWGENYVLYQDYGYKGYRIHTDGEDRSNLMYVNWADNGFGFIRWNDAISSAQRLGGR